MTEQKDIDNNGDGRHEFRSATVSADDARIVDDEGHEFVHGEVSRRDEADSE